MDGATGPPAPYEQPPRKRSGCLVALYVLFGIGLFIVVAGGIGIWVFLQTEQGQKVMQVAKSGAEWITVASTAPGTEELRGAGCETAMVGNAGSALDVFMILIPEEDKQAELREQLSMQAGEGDLDSLLLVICTLPRFTVSAPACEDLARTYSSAVEDEPDSFYVMVMQQGQDAPTCQGIYDPDGMLLRQPQLQP